MYTRQFGHLNLSKLLERAFLEYCDETMATLAVNDWVRMRVSRAGFACLQCHRGDLHIRAQAVCTPKEVETLRDFIW